MMDEKQDILELTADIVAAYVSHNQMEAEAVPELIRSVFLAMQAAVSEPARDDVKAPIPAVPVEKSVSDDYIICLEDGKKYKSLKRHLRTQYGLTPKAYRERWGLDADYPMVAPNYSIERSRLAKRAGLGKS